MGLRIANALFIALLVAYFAELGWLKLGYRKSPFGYFGQDLLEKDKQVGRWIFRFVFLVVFLHHFFFIGA